MTVSPPILAATPNTIKRILSTLGIDQPWSWFCTTSTKVFEGIGWQSKRLSKALGLNDHNPLNASHDLPVFPPPYTRKRAYLCLLSWDVYNLCWKFCNARSTFSGGPANEQ